MGKTGDKAINQDRAEQLSKARTGMEMSDWLACSPSPAQQHELITDEEEEEEEPRSPPGTSGWQTNISERSTAGFTFGLLLWEAGCSRFAPILPELRDSKHARPTERLKSDIWDAATPLSQVKVRFRRFIHVINPNSGQTAGFALFPSAGVENMSLIWNILLVGRSTRSACTNTLLRSLILPDELQRLDVK